MKFTLSWLKQHLDTSASCEAICDKLTAIGLEVEKVEDRSKALGPFIIAHVLKADKHPDADRLKVCIVDTGKEKLQVICGAPNCRAGIKAVLARPGDVMPDSGEVLKKGVIRGVESQGMLCATDELKLIDEETDGIIELPDNAPIGKSYAEWSGLNDPVIEINLTPNRPDCAGVRGIARDLAAAGIGKLKALEIKSVKGKEQSRIKVRLEFQADTKKNCPHFVGRLIRNIKNGPSPQWLQDRLRAIGLRPISALVDITNYVTIDLARPLHVFDAKKIRGNLWVRPAQGGEKIAALNGKTYILNSGMTAIGDDSGVLSIAGIMGGQSSSCDEATGDVFIESAYFDPARTAQTGRALQIISDARYRFERGIDPSFTLPGAEIATQLILEFCGTADTVVSDMEIAGSAPSTARTISFDVKKCGALVGVDVPESEQIQILTALGFEAKRLNAIGVPSWRPDVEVPADLVEEIIRIKGYDNIPTSSLEVPRMMPASAIDIYDWRSNMAKRVLASQGLMEAVTWSFMPSMVAVFFGEINPDLRLLNPISAELDVMRPSLLGNLVMAVKRNADRGFADVGLFEVGPTYKNATPEGQRLVAATLRAGATPRNWATAARNFDVYDAKADALAVLGTCGAPINSLQITADAPAWYHPGRSASLRLGPNLLGHFGEIHPALLAACGAEGPMTGCEICLISIPLSRNTSTAKTLLKTEPLQPVARDFAFLVDRSVSSDKLVKAIKSADKNLIRDVIVFDVYEGKNVAQEKKSIALSVILQPTERTLTDAELEDISSRIATIVAKSTGAALRS